MIPAAFDYARPASVDEAIGLLQADADAKVLAGGQSLLPLLKLRLASASRLIDIGRIGELRGVREIVEGLSIGALTTYREALDAPLLRERFPVLVDAIEGIGDVQVRNRGTIGGGIAHADPASDMPALILALDATVVLRSREGERILTADGFFTGPFTTAMHPGEILTEIRIPSLPVGAAAAYRSLEQRASGYSIVGVAAAIGSTGGTITHARVGIAGVAEAAYRARGVERALAGTDGSAGAIEAAARHAVDGVAVASDIHADSEYRAEMAKVFTRRAIEAALDRS